MERIEEESLSELSSSIEEHQDHFHVEEHSVEEVYEERETWSKSTSNYVTYWHSDDPTANPNMNMPSEELHTYLTQERGFSWGQDCHNWTMYTIWEPEVLKRLQFLKNMRPGLDTNPATWDEFWAVLEAGFKTFDVKIDSIADNSSNYVVARIDMQEGSSQNVLTNHSTQSLTVSEFIIGGSTENGGGYVTLRCTPLTLVAGGSLTDILKTTLRKNDILIAMGSVKRLDTPQSFWNPQRVTLLNYDDEDGDVVFIRLSFLPPSDEDVTLLESITPTAFENNFKFTYRVRQGKVFHTLNRVGNYIWSPLSSGPWNPVLFDNIPVPLYYDSDIGNVYHRVLEWKNQSPVRPQPAPQSPPVVPNPVQPVSHSPTAPPPPTTRSPRPKGVYWGDDETEEDREMPVFSANRQSNSSSTPAPSTVQRRYSAADLYIPTLQDMWTSICFLLMVALCCFFILWMSNTFLWPGGSKEEDAMCRGSSLISTQRPSSYHEAQSTNQDHSLTCVSQNHEISRIYGQDQESFLQVIVHKIVKIFLWIHENFGIRLIMTKLFGNATTTTNQQPYFGPIV